MSIPVSSTVLRNNSLFRELPEGTLGRIVRLARRRTMPAGAVLFSQGDPGDSFYGIVSGRVRISATSAEGREIHIVELGAGDTFGEIALLDGGPRTASAVVSEPSSLFVLQRGAFMSLIAEDADLAVQLVERLCQRVRWTSELVEDLSFLDVHAQIAKRIWLLAGSFGIETPHGFELKVAQADLAAFLGLSRQAVNNHLQSWREEGLIDISRGKLFITDMDKLRQVFAD